MFFGGEGTQKNGTNRYSVPPCRQKWQQKGRTVWQCCMPHATWLFVSDAVPRVPVFAFSLSLLFSVYFLLSSPVFISGAILRSRIPRHTSCVLHLISCRPHFTLGRSHESALRLASSFFVSFSRTPCPAPAFHFGAFTRTYASPLGFVFRFSFVLRTSLLGARTTPPVFVSRCRVSRLAHRARTLHLTSRHSHDSALRLPSWFLVVGFCAPHPAPRTP